MLETDHHYHCRLCDVEIKVFNLECASCGLTSGHYFRNSVNSLITLHCTECNSVLKPLNPPDICNLGHRGHCGWVNSTSKKWVESDLRTNNSDEKATWLRGNFECVYTGELEFTGLTFANEDQRSYVIEDFQIARLKNPQIIDGPPDKTPTGKKPPIRAEVVENVIVEYEDKITRESSSYLVSLYDFRLHDWQEVSGGEISGFFGKASTGRVSGTAYALIKSVPLHTPSNKSESSKTRQLSSGDQQSASESTKNTPALESHMEQVSPKTSSKFFDQSASANIASDSSSSNVKDIISNSAQCFACSTWLQLLLAAAVWYICGWKHALIFFAVVQFSCWLAELCAKHKWIVRSITQRNLLIGLIALLVTVGILIEAYSLAFSEDCAMVSDWAIYLIALAFALTSMLKYCWLRFSLLTIWFLTLLLWCSANGINCDNTKNNKRLDQFFEEINIHVDNAFHPDVISDIVNDVTTDPDNPDNNRKISIDEINNDPKLLENCKNSIYFPEVALFTKGSPKIEPRAHGQLRKLIPILKSHPGKKFIITGHSDKSGDETDIGYLNNIILSDQRAAEVAKWLTDNDAIDASLLDSRGAGTSMPLTNDLQRAEFNRRVEIQMECNDLNKRIKN